MGEVREGILPFPLPVGRSPSSPSVAGRPENRRWRRFLQSRTAAAGHFGEGERRRGLFSLGPPLPFPFLGPFAARPVLLSTSFFRWPRSKSSSWQNIGGGGIFCAAAKGPSPADCRVEGGKTMRFNFPKRGLSTYDTLGEMSRRKYFPASKKSEKRGKFGIFLSLALLRLRAGRVSVRSPYCTAEERKL